MEYPAPAASRKKKPGELVLGTNLKLYIVADDGREVPHEQPHRRAQRLAAEAFRARHGL